jgi:hypothetical protein
MSSTLPYAISVRSASAPDVATARSSASAIDTDSYRESG